MDPVDEAKATAAARAQAKQRAAQLTISTQMWRHTTLQLRPRMLPEVLVVGGRLGIDVLNNPTMLWLVVAVLTCDYLPAAWTKMSKQRRQMLGDDESNEQMMSKLSSTERLQYVSRGEVPLYFNALLGVSTEQHPMVSAIKEAERALTVPNAVPKAKSAADLNRLRFQANIK